MAGSICRHACLHLAQSKVSLWLTFTCRILSSILSIHSFFRRPCGPRPSVSRCMAARATEFSSLRMTWPYRQSRPSIILHIIGVLAEDSSVRIHTRRLGGLWSCKSSTWGIRASGSRTWHQLPGAISSRQCWRGHRWREGTRRHCRWQNAVIVI